MAENMTTISIAASMRDRIRALKRGGQSYTELLGAMADQYRPEEGTLDN